MKKAAVYIIIALVIIIAIFFVIFKTGSNDTNSGSGLRVVDNSDNSINVGTGSSGTLTSGDFTQLNSLNEEIGSLESTSSGLDPTVDITI